jgi:hypothetical protein
MNGMMTAEAGSARSATRTGNMTLQVLMQRRFACINDLPIKEADRKFNGLWDGAHAMRLDRDMVVRLRRRLGHEQQVVKLALDEILITGDVRLRRRAQPTCRTAARTYGRR